jgi:GNAT superfamily N-acetyltransferase
MPMSSPEAPSKLEIEVAPAAIAEDEPVVAEITDLINRVYATAEAGLWVDGAQRTTTSEIAEMIAAEQITVARVDGRAVGSVRIQQLDHRVGEFGMLVADPAHRGKGVGRELVRFAEELSRQRALTVMQLELLVPRTWSHPTKEFLHDWYTRIGYRPVRTGTIEETYPDLAPLLATPCDFVIYHKPLVANVAGRA